MLRPVRELERLRVVTAEGDFRGRIKDVYFDDQTWAIKCLVISVEPRQFGRKEVIIEPRCVASLCDSEGVVALSIPAEQLSSAPLATTVLPVCKQYASLAFSSPGSRVREEGLAEADPYLRSTKAVMNYAVSFGGSFEGKLVNFVFDGLSWDIRYLAIEQVIDRKKLLFHILPQSVERFTWATERVLLRELQPVALEPEQVVVIAAEAA